MIADFHTVGTLEDIDKLKIIDTGNEMTDDRSLNNVGGILSFPFDIARKMNEANKT